MNMIKFARSLSIAASTLVVVTFLYAQTGGSIQEVASEKTLNDVLKEHKEVSVFFYDPTCPVCGAFKKKGIYPATAQSLPNITFVMISSKIRSSVSTINEPKQREGEKFLYQKYQVKAFPTFVFFKNGQEIHRFSGYSENPHFTQQIDGIFKNAK